MDIKFLRNTILLIAFLFVANFSYAQDYTDLDENHWAYKYIQMLTDEGVVVGYPDGSFHPNEYVTRAEYASMAIKGLKMQDYHVKEVIEFDDIPLDYWAYDQIQRAAYFDLIDAKNKTFNPDGTVTRAHAISIVVNALTTENLSEEKAREILKKTYLDYYTIDKAIIITAGKATILGLVVEVPGKKNYLDAEKPATRAELCAFLFKMMEAAKLNPNKKIADAMPKIAEGIVIEEATVEGNIATIPAGTILPVASADSYSTQKNISGQEFIAKTPDNLVTKQNYLMLKKDDYISGRMLNVRKGIPILRNGKFNLETKAIKTHNDQLAEFVTISDLSVEHNGFWQKIWHFIIKNDRIDLQDGSPVSVKLLKPLKIDLGNGWIIE